MSTGRDRAGSDEDRCYERPRLTVHGSVAETTAANVIGSQFDKSIPAGASILSVFGGTSF